MIESTNYYVRQFDEISDRVDFVYYHPNMDTIKAFRDSEKSFPFEKLIKPRGVDYGITESGKDDGVYEFVNTQNLDPNGTINRVNLKYVDAALPEKLLQANQILVSRSRLVGRVAKVTEDFKVATFGSYIIRFQLRDDIDYNIDFLVRFLNSPLGQQQMTLLKTGSAGENINSRQLMDLRLPEVKRSRQQTIMKQVRLVEAEAVELEEQAANKAAMAGKRFLELAGVVPEMLAPGVDYYSQFIGSGRLDFEFNNPKYGVIGAGVEVSSTEFVELAEVVDFRRDSANPTKRPEADFLYADIGNVDTKWGELNWTVMKGKDAKSSRMRRLMREGDVLVSTTRPTRNAIAVVPAELDSQICSTGFAVLQCKPTMNNRFLFHALRTWLSNLQFAKHCSGSGYPAINQESDLPHIRVPVLRSVDDQAQIASEVDALLGRARAIEGEARAKHEEAKAVFDRAIAQDISVN